MSYQLNWFTLIKCAICCHCSLTPITDTLETKEVKQKKYAQRRASKGTTVYIPSPLKEENMYIPWKLLAFLSKDFILF